MIIIMPVMIGLRVCQAATESVMDAAVPGRRRRRCGAGYHDSDSSHSNPFESAYRKPEPSTEGSSESAGPPRPRRRPLIWWWHPGPGPVTHWQAGTCYRDGPGPR
jgi:hypothetical protein